MRKSNQKIIMLLCCVTFLLTSAACAGTQKKKDITQTADYAYKMGVGYFEARQIPPAIKALTEAIKRDPKHERAHYVLGYIYMGRRDYNKAIVHFKEAAKLKPSFYDAKNALGATYLAMNRWRDAADVFEKLLEEPMYSSPELVHNNVGWAFYNMRKYPKAVEHFKMAIFLQPKFCLGHNNLGLSYDKVRKAEAAARHYRKAIELCPHDYAEPHFNLGKLLQKNGNPQAKLHFKRCSELQPESTLGERCRQFLSAY